MSQPISRIAINTGGGDAPGLNAVIRAVVLSALNEGWEVVGIRDGYKGVLAPEDCPDGGLIPLSREAVRGITHLGGTILGTTNRGNPLAYPTLGEINKRAAGAYFSSRLFDNPVIGQVVGAVQRWLP